MTSQGPADRDARVHIRQLPTGVPGLDEILGGGLPEYSFNIIAGAPGSGKTTLAHQFVFANASPERPAVYLTVLGEPALKMMQYQQQFTFFEQSKLDGAIRFVNLSRRHHRRSRGIKCQNRRGRLLPHGGPQGLDERY
jgi:circadian clock protein KaiC